MIIVFSTKKAELECLAFFMRTDGSRRKNLFAKEVAQGVHFPSIIVKS